MGGIVDEALKTDNPLIVILSIIVVALAVTFGTFIHYFWKNNVKEIKRLNDIICSKDLTMLNINKEKDDIVEARNRQLAEISEKAFTVISNNNISSIRCRDALKIVMEKINSQHGG